jgi:hypothetical protein
MNRSLIELSLGTVITARVTGPGIITQSRPGDMKKIHLEAYFLKTCII